MEFLKGDMCLASETAVGYRELFQCKTSHGTCRGEGCVWLVWNEPLIYGKGILFLGGWKKGNLPTINA